MAANIIIIDATPYPEVGEECDDGNLSDEDGCTGQCIKEYCGDGVLNNAGQEV